MKMVALQSRSKLYHCHFFPPQHSDSTAKMTELCRLELARITTAKNKNKVSRHKDTVENKAQTATVAILLFYTSMQN